MKKRFLIPFIICAVMLIVNIIARFSRSFSDFYVQKIFPYVSGFLSRISGLVSFSVGEIMVFIGIIIITVSIPLFIVLMIIRKGKRRKTAASFACVFLWIFTFVFSSETMNCFVMYRCTPLSERYFSNGAERSDEQLTELYSMLIEKSNELSQKVPRDSNNRFYISCDYMNEAKKAMAKSAQNFEQLSGNYPDAKPLKCSFFMSQAGLLGVYFPFSMESNYNKDAVDTNFPSTICHEYAHLKGIIQEDEANFLSFIATTGSDNSEFQYSGYLNALEYVHNEIYSQDIISAYPLTDTISDEVLNDWFRFLPDNYWEDNSSKEILSTETVETATSVAIDTNIRLNGREDGERAYSMVVNLLLDYYFTQK
ncbi:MAG: DUF3810 domain-containing protein [Ruminococcus sp.]|nr:DUF3810 domain-containing protein [Ruminococcus sp.]